MVEKTEMPEKKRFFSEGLAKVFKIDTKRVDKVTDVVSVGDEIQVKLIEVDRQGRINLSRKDALIDLEKKAEDAE